MEWEEASDVYKDLTHIVTILKLDHIDVRHIHCYRTHGSKTQAYARTWSFPKIFQRALGVQPAYVIEVLSRHYDRLSENEKKKVIIHELLHIPKNFSGALLPHKTRSRNLHTAANKLYKEYLRAVQ